MDTKKISKRDLESKTVVRWPVSVLSSHSQFEAQAEKIGPDGVVLSCQESPPVEGNFDMLIKAPNAYPMRVTGRLVWTEFPPCEDGEHRISADVKFVAISDKDRRFLQNVITSHYKAKISSLARNSELAARIIAKDSTGSPNDPAQEQTDMEMGHDAVPVTVRTRLHMTDIARVLGTELEVLKKLNPKLISYYLPLGSYTLNVPSGLGFKLPSVLQQLSRNAFRRLEQNSPGYYVVRAGDTLRDIARKTGVSALNLARFNQIHGSSLKVGQKLRLSRGIR